MSQADELLEEELQHNHASGLGEAEEHVIIGQDRIVHVPDGLKRIAIQYDDNIESVTFDCPRYWDEHDMSEMEARINYMRSDGGLGTYICGKPTVDEDDDTIIHFVWVVSGHVTEVFGALKFVACIVNAQPDGTIMNHWNSELCVDMYVNEGLETTENITVHYADEITRILTRMDDLEALGMSVVINVDTLDNGDHIVTITNTAGTVSFTVPKGDTGPMGTYKDCTEEEKNQLIDDVLAALPTYDGTVTRS